MSIFKEKDDIIRCAFQRFNYDSDEDGGPVKTTEQSSNVIDPDVIDPDVSDPEVIDPKVIDAEVIDAEIIDPEVIEPDVVDISSDDDDIVYICPGEPKQILKQNTSLEDHDFTLKFIIAGKYQKCQTNYGASLAEALQFILDDLSRTGKSLKLFLKDQEVSLDNTPKSLELGPGSILHAIEIPLAGDPVEQVELLPEENESLSESNALNIKLQDGNRKHTKDIRISKNEPLVKLKSIYAKTFNLSSIDNIKLYFDGDEIDDESTADDIELEDGFAVDVVTT